MEVRERFGFGVGRAQVIKPPRITRVDDVDHPFQSELGYRIDGSLAGKIKGIIRVPRAKAKAIVGVCAMAGVVENKCVVRPNLYIQPKI